MPELNRTEITRRDFLKYVGAGLLGAFIGRYLLPLPNENPTPTPTGAPYPPEEGYCSAYKVDFAPPAEGGHSGYVIDFGSPGERMVGNFWSPGKKETTYIAGRQEVIRGFYKGYGNYWKFPDSCNGANLVERAINYAKGAGPSRHTGKVYLVNPDGSVTLITKNAFEFDLDYNELPRDPTN